MHAPLNAADRADAPAPPPDTLQLLDTAKQRAAALRQAAIDAAFDRAAAARRAWWQRGCDVLRRSSPVPPPRRA